mmetsp:Transcript_2385/g.5138  ORF Transcript_2385/g.5138 Transcript_2385/m.5138 type:complete len:217 (-) Transcript_2385:215-865(-)
MSTRGEEYFLAGKEERGKTSRTTSGRVSSKQIGEELTNLHRKDYKSGTVSRPNLVCETDQAAQYWPLFAYEMSLSVDQEERWLQAHKRCQANSSLPSDRTQTGLAASAMPRLKTAVRYHMHATGHRNRTALLDVLTPEQTAQFWQWFLQNRERCKDVLLAPERGSSDESNGEQRGKGLGRRKSRDGSEMSDTLEVNSLDDICQRLNEVLNIQKQES